MANKLPETSKFSPESKSIPERCVKLIGKPRSKQLEYNKQMLLDDLIKGTTTLEEAIDASPEHFNWLLSIQKIMPRRKTSAKVLYLYSNTGYGKSFNTERACRDLKMPYYKKPPDTKWFDGYIGQTVIIFEYHNLPILQWNSLCDPYPPLVQVKRDKRSIQATHYIILSHHSPDEEYLRAKLNQRQLWDMYRQTIDKAIHYTGPVFEQIYSDVDSFLSN